MNTQEQIKKFRLKKNDMQMTHSWFLVNKLSLVDRFSALYDYGICQLKTTYSGNTRRGTWETASFGEEDKTYPLCQSPGSSEPKKTNI